MFKLIWNNFKKTNHCIILATPMVLFMFLTLLYLGFTVTHAKTVNLALLSLLTLLIMIGGFLAGWFYMVKKTLELSERTFVYENDRIHALKQLFMSLPNGVGKYFVSFIQFLIISMLSTVFLYSILNHIFPVMEMEKLANFLMFRNHIAVEVFITSSILSFFGILWVPEIIYNEKNAIKALKNSLIKTFKTFPKTFGLYLYIYMLYCVINFGALTATQYPILVFALLIIYYYFLLYFVILVFTYYEQTFLKRED